MLPPWVPRMFSRNEICLARGKKLSVRWYYHYWRFAVLAMSWQAASAARRGREGVAQEPPL